MFGLFLGSLIALVSAQIIYAPPNPVNINGPDVATRVQLLPGGGFRLFDAEDADNIFYPTAPQMPPSRVIYMDAQDVDNYYRSPRRLARTSHVCRSLKPVRYAAEDLSNFNLERPIFPGQKPLGPFHIPPRLVPLRGSDSEDLKNEIKWHVTVGNKDEVENGGVNWGEVTKIAGQIHDIGKVLGFSAEDAENKFPIGKVIKHVLPYVLAADEADSLDIENGVNWGEITKIAGQVNEIGHILGFDAEDAENIPIPAACAIIGAACALANTGMNIYDHVKGSDEAEELTNGGINWGEITKIAGQIHDIGKVLGFDAEDAEDVKWSVTVGNKDELENILPGGCTRPRPFRIPRKH